MTVLSDADVQEQIDSGEFHATRNDGKELAIQPASMDLHLGRKIKYPSKQDDKPVSVDKKSTYPQYASIDTPRPLVREGTFALATTQEEIQIPNGMVALLHGRSSVGRLGLFIENAGLIDPGFSGQVTLELTNVVDYDIELVAGMRIGQLTFHEMKTTPQVGYSKYNGSKYDGQIGPTTSRLYEDFE
jgi:dCTP deaminase